MLSSVDIYSPGKKQFHACLGALKKSEHLTTGHQFPMKFHISITDWISSDSSTHEVGLHSSTQPVRGGGINYK